MSERTKICKLCGQRRYLSEFYRHATNADGLDHRCITCVRRKARGRRVPCAFCGKVSARRFCSEGCVKRHAVSVDAEQVRRPRIKLKLGPMIIPPLGPPRCACGQLQKFGSDSMTGASITCCPSCGEAPLPVYRGAAA